MKLLIGFALKVVCVALLGMLDVALAHAGSGVTYQGRILKPDGSPISGTNVQFRIQIRTPDTSNCLMYEELQAIDMSLSRGSFSLTINDGSGIRQDTTGLGLDKIFANRGSFIFDPTTCSSGSTYAPNPSDGRVLQVFFKDTTMTSWEPIPPQKLNFVPYSFESKQIAGFGIQNLLHFDLPVASPKNASPLSEAEFDKLMALIDGTSSQFEQKGKLNSAAIPSMGTGEVLGWNGSGWQSVEIVPPNSVTANKIQDAAINSAKLQDGTVAGIDLANNITIITSGNISSSVSSAHQLRLFDADLAPDENSVTLRTPASLSTDTSYIWPGAYGPAGSVLTTDAAGTLSWTSPGTTSQWVNGSNNSISYSTGPVGVGTTNPVTKLEVTGSLKIGDGGETCDAAHMGSIRYTGSNLQFCAGTMPWTTLGVAGSGISALTGDVSATGSGSVASTVAAIGGSTAADVHAAELLANAATPASAIGEIVRRDSAGSFVSNIATLNGLSLKNASSSITLSSPVGASYSLVLPGTAGTSGQLLTSNGSGSLTWTSPLSAGFIQGGNSFAAAAELGTSDNYSLNFKANNSVQMTILPSGNVGIGTASPTAKLQLAAGTTAPGTAPLKLGAGVPLIAPEVGAIEFDGTKLFYTDSTNTRKTVSTSNSSVVVKTGDYTLLNSDDIVLGNAASGAITLTLPSAVGSSGHQYTIKKTDSSSNLVVIQTSLGQTIDGGSTTLLVSQYKWVSVVSDGANWWIVNQAYAANSPVISIISATYGAGCSNYSSIQGNVTACLSSCNGAMTCASKDCTGFYVGDPSSGCAKGLEVIYRCTGDISDRTALQPGESSGISKAFTCP